MNRAGSHDHKPCTRCGAPRDFRRSGRKGLNSLCKRCFYDQQWRKPVPPTEFASPDSITWTVNGELVHSCGGCGAVVPVARAHACGERRSLPAIESSLSAL